MGVCAVRVCLCMYVHIHHNLTFFYHHTTPVYIVTVIVIVIACVVIIQDTDLSLIMEVMVWASSGWCASCLVTAMDNIRDAAAFPRVPGNSFP